MTQERPRPTLHLRSDVDRELFQEYLGAFGVVRSIRQKLFILLLLALLFPFVVYVGVRWNEVRVPASPAVVEGHPEPAEAAKPNLYRIASVGMKLAEFSARILVILLALSYLLAVNICLSGHLGGAQDAIAAFFWMVFLLLFLVPWQTWLGSDAGPSVFFSVDPLLKVDSALPSHRLALANHYCKYLGLPFLGILTAVVADFRFGRSYQQALHRMQQRMDISVH